MATAFIVVPVGLAAAAQMGVSPAPVLMAIAVFAAAALLTPVATPANLAVMEAAGYRFTDYWKSGLPLLLRHGLDGIVGAPSVPPLLTAVPPLLTAASGLDGLFGLSMATVTSL